MLLTLSASFSFAQDSFSEDDTYDPFADYSEFEASEDEEADIHFFKNGRFFNLALMLGGRTFTQELGSLSEPSLAFGFYLAYFFDIRSALQISYVHSSHPLDYPPVAAEQFDGISATMALSTLAAHFKYYFNTANITRGFADLNPFLIGGFSINYRNIKINGEDVLVKSNPTGIELGGGIEVPIARNKMYLGIQALYHYVTFPDENEVTVDADGDPSLIKPQGDYVSVMATLGINF